MPYPQYSYNDSPAPVNPSNISSLPPSVQRNPPLPVANPFRMAATPAGQPDYSVFDSMDPQGPTGPSGPVPNSGGSAGNPFLSFLASLFSRGVGGGATPQGMTGLLARGQGAPGTNTLGNPFNRFG
jgi:hypothetical protein